MRLFAPESYVNSIFDITPAWMDERGLKALLVDIDDTLSPHGSLVPSRQAHEWAAAMQGAGFRLIAFSNNHEKRVAPFAKALGVPYVFDAGKPLPKMYRRAVERFDLPKNSIAAAGDQIFTDILGANLAGVRSVLVLSEERSAYGVTRLKRFFERLIVAKLKRRPPA